MAYGYRLMLLSVRYAMRVTDNSAKRYLFEMFNETKFSLYDEQSANSDETRYLCIFIRLTVPRLIEN